MATGGWGGSMGAWGSKPQQTPDYDPDLDAGYSAPAAGAPAAQPLYDAPTPVAAPSNAGFQGAFGGPTAGSQDLVAREAALNKRAKELAEKEKKLNVLEKELQSSGGIAKKNWPICWPFLYHNIPEEIPEKSRRVVREIYVCWWGLVLCLCWNFFCASVILGTDADQKVPSWFLALLYALCGIPLSFWGWYLGIYKAGKNDSTASYIAFFCCFCIHTGFCIWAAIAVPFSAEQWSFAGWITAMKAFDKGAFPGIIYIVGASLWTCEAVYCLWCLKDAYLFFRGQGGVEQAKQDAALSVFKAGMQHSVRQQV